MAGKADRGTTYAEEGQPMAVVTTAGKPLETGTVEKIWAGYLYINGKRYYHMGLGGRHHQYNNVGVSAMSISDAAEYIPDEYLGEAIGMEYLGEAVRGRIARMIGEKRQRMEEAIERFQRREAAKERAIRARKEKRKTFEEKVAELQRKVREEFGALDRKEKGHGSAGR